MSGQFQSELPIFKNEWKCKAEVRGIHYEKDYNRNKIDDEVVLAKKAAAEEMAVASGVHYLMYAGSTLMKSNVLEPTLAVQQTSIDI